MSPLPEALISISIDPDALRDHPRDSDEAVHNTLVDRISDRGVLTISDSDLDDLYDAIRGLSDLPKTLWVKLLGALYDLNRLDQDSDALSVTNLLSELGPSEAANKIRLLVASGAAAAAHGVDYALGSRFVGETEVVLAGTVHRAALLQDSEAVGIFPGGQSRRSVVASRFLEPLARRSHAVKAVDPHLLEDIVNGSATIPHTEWLVTTLGMAMPPNATLSVLGKLQWHWDSDERIHQEARIAEFLARALSGRTDPLTVHVRAVKATPLKNRFLWFSCGHSYDVLHNFAPLADDPLNEELRFSRQIDSVAEETFRTAERIENASQATMVSVTRSFP